MIRATSRLPICLLCRRAQFFGGVNDARDPVGRGPRREPRLQIARAVTQRFFAEHAGCSRELVEQPRHRLQFAIREAPGAHERVHCRQRRPDLVILDCNMPELSGVLVLRKMRDLAELADTPVLMLTGRQSARDSEIAYFAGADDYMTKPFDPDELVFRVEDLLKRKSAAKRAAPAAARR